MSARQPIGRQPTGRQPEGRQPDTESEPPTPTGIFAITSVEEPGINITSAESPGIVITSESVL